ncbi:MAG: NAD(P)-binding domain-containing protein [Microthrixaceae bacterium]|nr:NAD(P)-binding domain-containing protein [Microthrixaceae bacterium]MCO5322368.1 NAD(P)-binding domain-containing protein [Microthrixaceae bacterium]
MDAARTTDVVVIGGGQAGLAMSHSLTDRSIDHVVLERAEVANSWTTERWDSLRTLTPNWMSRLPGFSYDGDDPNGYMTAGEVAAYLESYRRSFGAPVRTGVEVQRIRTLDRSHVVETSEGPWFARSVVMATGACSQPRVPAIAADLPGNIQQLTPTAYRNPAQVAPGAVLVVGASASGLQIADELSRSGREVTLAVGDHVRLPRTYRGMDIHWWMQTTGLLDERFDEVEDLARARRLPSLQLVGSPEQRDLDLNTAAANGVNPVGRLAGIRAGRAQFSGSFANMCTSADLKQNRLLDEIDEYAASHGLDAEIGPTWRPAPTSVGRPALELDLRSVGSVVWATGFRPTYPWLDESLVDGRGQLVHDGGVLAVPGLYVLGLPFMRRRKSSFIDGVGPDAEELAAHLVGHLERSVAGAA